MKFELGPILLGAGVAAVSLAFLFAPAGFVVGAAAAVMGNITLNKMNSGSAPDADIAHVKLGFALGAAGALIGCVYTMAGLFMMLVSNTALGRLFAYLSIAIP